MSIQVLCNGTSDLAGSGTSTMAVFGNRVWNGSFSETVFPAGGTVSRLRISLVHAPGAGNSRTFTLFQNGSSTALTVTISGTSTTGEDLTNSVSVAAADRLQVQQTVSGAPGTTFARWSMRWVPTTEDLTVMCLTTDTTKLASGLGTTQQLAPSGCQPGPFATTEVGQRVYFPTGGTLNYMYVKLSAAPGTISGRTRTFTVVLNETDTALQVVIDGNVTTGNDISSPVSVVDGDYIYIKSVVGSLNVTAAWVTIGMVFEPTTKGRFLVPSSGDVLLPTDTTSLDRHPCTAGAAWLAIDGGDSQSFGQFMRLHRWRVHLTSDPTGIGTWSLISMGGALEGLYLIFATTEKDKAVSEERILADDDTLFIRCVPSNIGDPAINKSRASGTHECSVVFLHEGQHGVNV